MRSTRPPGRIRVFNPYTLTFLGILAGFFIVNFLVITNNLKTHYSYTYKVYPACKCNFQGSILEDDPNKAWTGDTACFDECIRNPLCKAAEQMYVELGEGVSTCKLYSEKCPKMDCVGESKYHSMVSEMHNIFYIERDEIKETQYL